VRFQVLTAANMKMTVFWDVVPCGMVEHDWHFRGAYCLHHLPDEGGSKHLWNVGQYLPDYMAQHPKSQLSSGNILTLGAVCSDFDTCVHSLLSGSSGHWQRICVWIHLCILGRLVLKELNFTACMVFRACYSCSLPWFCCVWVFKRTSPGIYCFEHVYTCARCDGILISVAYTAVYLKASCWCFLSADVIKPYSLQD
jgi:hypothetical protein